ncbi:MFS transporter [Chloroflexota bacterium]
MSFLTVFLARLSIGPLAPFFKESLNLSNTQVGALVSATGIAQIPSLLAAGWLVDHIGAHRVLAMGTFVTSLSILALFFAPSYQVMFAILVISGLGCGCIFPSIVKSIISWFPMRERATALGLNQTAINVAGITGATLLPTVAITLGWRYGFLFLGCGALAICLCVVIFYRSSPQEELPIAAGNTPNEASTKSSTAQPAINLFKSRDIWMVILTGFFLTTVEFSAIAYLVLYLNEVLLFSAVIAGGLLAMTEAAGAVAKPASGLATDRLFGGRPKIIFLIMSVTTTIIFFTLGIGGHQVRWLIYPVLIILGMVAIGWGGLWATMLGELGGKTSVGMISGTGAAANIMGLMGGPVLFGYIVDSTDSFQTAWLVMALISILSVVSLSLVRENKRQV